VDGRSAALLEQMRHGVAQLEEAADTLPWLAGQLGIPGVSTPLPSTSTAPIQQGHASLSHPAHPATRRPATGTSPRPASSAPAEIICPVGRHVEIPTDQGARSRCRYGRHVTCPDQTNHARDQYRVATGWDQSSRCCSRRQWHQESVAAVHGCPGAPEWPGGTER
jgi:hypothetical protein